MQTQCGAQNPAPPLRLEARQGGQASDSKTTGNSPVGRICPVHGYHAVNGIPLVVLGWAGKLSLWGGETMRFLFALLLLVGLADPANARCVSTWLGHWGVDSTAHVLMDGGVCGLPMHAAGTSEIHSIRITARPRHGSAGVRGYVVAYRAKPGFKGQDSFSILITGRLSGQPKQMNVRVAVTVQ